MAEITTFKKTGILVIRLLLNNVYVDFMSEGRMSHIMMTKYDTRSQAEKAYQGIMSDLLA